MLKNNKSWLVIFEGQDETGKSSIAREFNKLSKFMHTVVDRGFISTSAYSIKFGRGNALDPLISLVKIAKHINVLIVLCTSSVDCIKKRLKTSEKQDYISLDDESLINEIIEDRVVFDTCSSLCSDNCFILKLKTDDCDPIERATKVVEFIKSLENI